MSRLRPMRRNTAASTNPGRGTLFSNRTVVRKYLNFESDSADCSTEWLMDDCQTVSRGRVVVPSTPMMDGQGAFLNPQTTD